MPNITVEIKNLPEIRAAFKQAPKLMVDNLNDAIKKTALYIQGKELINVTQRDINVVTGGLKNAVQRGIWFGNLKAEVGTDAGNNMGVPYAGFVHEGTRFMRARPFLADAVEESQDNIDKFFKDAVQDTLDKIARKI